MLREAVGELLARTAGDDGLVPADDGRRAVARARRVRRARGRSDGLGAVELALIAWSLGGRLAAVPYVDAAALAYVVPGHGRAALCLSEPGRSFAPDEPSTSLDGRRGSPARRARVAFAGDRRRLAVTAAGPDGVVARARLAGRGRRLVRAGGDARPEPAAGARALRRGRRRSRSPTGPLVESLAAIAGVLAAAEAVGAAAAVLELARAYAAQRRQFGHTIGSFQAIRHLLADMYVKVESSWSSVLYAAAALDEREPDALRTASIAKAYAGRATHEVAHGALQVFGGIAFTAEHPAHRFLRRIAVRGGPVRHAPRARAQPRTQPRASDWRCST